MKSWIIAATAAFTMTGAAHAAEVTIKVHHFLPATAPIQTAILEPWEKAVEEQSGGRIDVQIFPSMQLGGKPPQLFDQARDGVVDVSWTLLSYTPGRFPISEVFELPFVAGTAKANTLALQDFQAKYLGDEFAQVKPLLLHAPAYGKLHIKGKAVEKLEDLKGLKIRAPSRTMTDALNALGASAVGMPVPEVAQAMTTGVIDGALVPWEVVASLRLHEIAKEHTEFDGGHGLYTSVMALVMNKATYDKLPDDLKKVIDDTTGAVMAEQAAATYDDIENNVRQQAIDAGNTIHTIPADQIPAWQAATQPVIDAWIADMGKRNLDGAAMLEEVRASIAAHSE